MIYVVLGMHKSGTTLVAKMLHESGISMVEDFDQLLSYEQGNKVEREAMQHINYELIGGEDVHSLDIPNRDITPAQLRSDQIAKIRQAIQKCVDNYRHWGFKDPRTCITYPVWLEYLPPHKLIVVYRHYTDAMYYYWRQTRRRRKLKNSLKAARAWKQMNRRLLDIVKRSELPVLVLNYGDLMKDDKLLPGISNFLETPLKDARRKSPAKKRNFKYLFIWLERLTGGSASRIYRQLEALKYRPKV